MKANGVGLTVLCMHLIGVGGCGSPRVFRSPTPSASEASSGVCDELAKTCHEHDAQSPLAHECHELGHSGSEEHCRARRDECWNECHSALRGRTGSSPSP